MTFTLSEETLSILKNFSSINSNIVINSGNTVSTISNAKNIMATVEVTESFPTKFGIYDLNEFLGVLGLVNEPGLNFKDSYVEISDESSGRSKIKYFYSDPEILTTVGKNVKMPKEDISFVLDESDLNAIKRAASTLGHNELSITGKDGVLTLSVVDNQNATSNVFSVDVAGDFDCEGFNYIMSIPNLKLLPGNYNVKISNKLITEFQNQSSGVLYWIALEKSSTVGE